MPGLAQAETSNPRTLGTNASNRRLEKLIKTNLINDLLAQVIILVLFLVWLPTPWMFMLWLSRWPTIGGISLSWRVIRSSKRQTAALFLAGGHCVGVVLTCLIVPIFAPITMLVLVGDLLLVPFLDPGVRRRFVAGVLCVAALSSLATLQSWSGLTNAAPRWMVVTAIVLHTLATGAAISRSHRENYVSLTSAEGLLQQMEQRLAEAIEGERRALSTAMHEGPVVDLDALRGAAQRGLAVIETEPTAATAIANANAVAVQESLRRLRTLSHGIFPDSLFQHGVAAAFSMIDLGAGRLGSIRLGEQRFDRSIESAIYVCLADVARMADSVSGQIDAQIETGHHGSRGFIELRIVVHCDASNLVGFSSRVSGLSQFTIDRVIAVDGEIDTTFEDRKFVLVANITQRTINDQQLDNDHRESVAASNHRILDSFVRSSLVAAVAGLLLTFALLLTTGSAVAGLIAVIMVFVLGALLAARRFLQHNQLGNCVQAICVEAGAAGVLVTLLEPRSAPVTGLITVLPLVLALPHFARRSLDWIAGTQTLALTLVTLIGYFNNPLTETRLALALLQVIVPIAAAGVAYLVAQATLGTTDETTRASAVVRASLRTIVSDADSERQALERDLHDGAQQQFVALSMQFRTLAKLIASQPQRATEIAQTTIERVRLAREEIVALASGSSLPSVAEGRLRDALRIAASLSAQPVSVSWHGVEVVSPEVAKATYLCCHEAIQNAAKHGGDRVAVAIDVRVAADFLNFAVRDTGVGFDPKSTAPGRGLASLNSRLTAFGGTISISSAVGSGTVVTGAVPLR